ncbi:hypothetical protein B0H10DRAFT_1957010 [Mycena sp. CBHHK59/15]|nr:hypothetical protein B0H10DRAFT_1957010 [Mycena sp. CBHHK59/15]
MLLIILKELYQRKRTTWKTKGIIPGDVWHGTSQIMMESSPMMASQLEKYEMADPEFLRLDTNKQLQRRSDILENEEESDDEAGEHISTRLVNSGAAWRKVYTSWVVAARVEEMAAEDTEGSQTVVEPPAPQRPGFPQPPGGRAPRKAFTQQQLLMELLAAEHSEEEPDDGELEGSGDDYDSDD